MSAVAMALRKEKVDEAIALIERQVESGSVAAAALHVYAGQAGGGSGLRRGEIAGRGIPAGVDFKADDRVGGDAALGPQAALDGRPGEQVTSPNSAAARRIASCCGIC